MMTGNYLRQYFLILFFLGATSSLSAQTWLAPVPILDRIGANGNTGYYTKLLVINGNPAIAYYDLSHSALIYVRATTADGSSWDTPICVDSIGDVGKHVSIQVVNGNPAITYYDETNGNLKYIRALQL
jgi:hypothetical protein